MRVVNVTGFRPVTVTVTGRPSNTVVRTVVWVLDADVVVEVVAVV